MVHWLKRITSTLLALAVTFSTGAAYAQSTIKVMYTDPLSGPFAQVGDQNLQQFKYIIDYINGRGGALGRKFELVSFDNKSQPSEALLALKAATDQNIPVIMQCSGSNIAAALIEGVDKHNERNPTNRIVYVNCGAVATELTNEKCSFWHFRMDAHVGMKAETMVRALPKDVTKVYLLNQDYLFGQSVQRDMKAFLTKLRPDVKVVGDELIPLGKVKDFSPYVTKIKASGAQALITGNWGPDMTLLIKAGMDSGLDIRYYTMYAHLGGGATAIGPAGNGKVRSVMAFHENIAVETGKTDTEGWTRQFRAQHDFDFYAAGFRTIFEFLQAAMNKAGSADPLKFAQALEGLTITDMLGYQVTMRKPDHQILSEYFVGVFTKGVKYDSEKTGLGWKTETTVLPKDLDQPNTCNMKRPTS
ncbi:MAG TPA: branched-chain amino acid ABC transporter substrate-binding protein [Candidatus Dormibacteraeota bacterium]|nr:branched-chain amino acid ABC transporter substrate-binding protein [Candidatus Dormibacteraeota bacterium]